MNLKGQLSWATLIALLCAIGFGAVCLLVSDKKIAQFDSKIINYIQGLESPWLTKMMKFFTFIGSGISVAIISIIVMIILYKFLHHRHELMLFIWIVIGTALVNDVLKNLFHRARPALHRIVEANGFSFPSGHSMAAFSLYGVIAFLLWKHISSAFGRGLLICISTFMIMMIGISRIYLGVHYPSDVLGGFLASGFLLGLSIWVYQRYMEKAKAKSS